MKDCFSASSAALRKLLSAQDAPRRKVSDKKQQSTLLAVILGRTKTAEAAGMWSALTVRCAYLPDQH